MLERECGRHVELMWLMRKLGPDSRRLRTSAKTTDKRSGEYFGNLS